MAKKPGGRVVRDQDDREYAPNQPIPEPTKNARAMINIDDEGVLQSSATLRNRYQDGSHLYGGRRPNIEK